MKATKQLLVAALAAGGLIAAGSALADTHGHGGGHWSGGHSAGHWSGGHWGGGHGWSGNHWHGGGWGFYLGVPLFWPSYYWGAPYYYPGYPVYDYGYGYPVYQDYAPAPQDQEQDLGPAPQAAPGPGAPNQGPLYMNYCASAKAYYPKVTQCPEGWKFIAPTR